MSKLKIDFMLNGKKTSIETEPGKRLVDVLREDLKLTGTKEGCSIGECGACTVLLNDDPVNSCLILAGQIQNMEVITIEGLEQNGKTHILQEQFLDHGAVQCGFCSPGMILSAFALLQKNQKPTISEIEEAIAGNLCRCTGYKQIVEAVQSAAESIKRK